jgi:hypothetical protein
MRLGSEEKLLPVRAAHTHMQHPLVRLRGVRIAIRPPTPQ